MWVAKFHEKRKRTKKGFTAVEFVIVSDVNNFYNTLTYTKGRMKGKRERERGKHARSED